MTENEQADEAWQVAQAMPDVAEMIAKDARENLGGTEVVSVGSVYAREIHGVMCHAVAAIVPVRDGTDFVPSKVILDVRQNHMVACVNRMTLISCLEDHFARVQVFGTELALAKYCQKEWPSEEMDQVVAEMKRGLNSRMDQQTKAADSNELSDRFLNRSPRQRPRAVREVLEVRALSPS